MYTKAIYQILKAIDVSYENRNFDFETTLDLNKLGISQNRLELLIENLYNDGLISGLNTSARDIKGNCRILVSLPRLTTEGMLFLENNSNMKKAYAALKELKEWIPGL